MTDMPRDGESANDDLREDAGAAETKSWQALEQEIGDLKDRLLRAVAETENVRRRAERERAEALQYAASRFARDILSVADNLRRALTALEGVERTTLPDTVQNLLAGVELTERELLSIFARHGIKPFDPTGQKFDPHQHEVMFEIPGSDQPAGTVLQVIETGYMIGDRLLRPARVGIAKGEAKPGYKAASDPEPGTGSGLDTSA